MSKARIACGLVLLAMIMVGCAKSDTSSDTSSDTATPPTATTQTDK